MKKARITQKTRKKANKPLPLSWWKFVILPREVLPQRRSCVETRRAPSLLSVAPPLGFPRHRVRGGFAAPENGKRKAASLREGDEGGGDEGREGLGREGDVEADLPAADVELGESLGGGVDKGGEVFLHAQGRTAAVAVAGEREELGEGKHGQGLDAGGLGGLLEVQAAIGGDDEDKGLVALGLGDEGLEDNGRGNAELGGDLGGLGLSAAPVKGMRDVREAGGLEDTLDVGLLGGLHGVCRMARAAQKRTKAVQGRLS